jgi:hypothetical protein
MAPTSGYFLATLRVADVKEIEPLAHRLDESSSLTLACWIGIVLFLFRRSS